MSSDEDHASQRRDFYPTRIPVRAPHVSPNHATGRPSPASGRTVYPESTVSSNAESWRAPEPQRAFDPQRASEPASHGENSGQQNTFRQMIRSLQQQVHDLRDQNALLTTLIHRNTYDDPKPEVCRWELVKPHMGAIAKRLMLGLNPRKNRPFPREDHIKEVILEAFDTAGTDSMTRKVFDRVWVETLRKKVRLLISNRRGRFSTIARSELWRNLGVPKPQQATNEEIEAWKQSLKPLAENNRWRWNGDDPFGSDAFCNTIAFVKFGRRYSNNEPLMLTAKQMAWFAYVMHLAMDGDRNMKESEMRLHKKEIKNMKHFIMDSRPLLNRIEIVVAEVGDTVQEVLGEDCENEV